MANTNLTAQDGLAATNKRQNGLGSPQNVLICGAGFAGLATAFWLNLLGYRTTVVEIADGLRKGGTPVDIESEAIDVLKRMGLFEAVIGKTLPPRSFEFKNADDSTAGMFPADPASDGKKYEIHRDDLLEILSGVVIDSSEMVFGRSIRQLDNQPDQVTVTFDDGTQRNFDLVFGCDGNRSRTRQLVFGAAHDFTYFMGGYFFIKVVSDTALLPANVSQIFSVAGRTALLNGYGDRTDIALAFRSEVEVDYGQRDRAKQRRMIHDHFDGLTWKVPAMLAHLDRDDDFYFDKINQVRMPTWSIGRVALVGDAGYCVSPVAGMGGSMAIIGAARLADALRQHGEDYAAAFRSYHDGLHSFVAEAQEKAVQSGMAIMFPADEAEMAERDRKIAMGELNL